MEGRADAIPNAAGGHGAARPDGVIHRCIFNRESTVLTFQKPPYFHPKLEFSAPTFLGPTFLQHLDSWPLDFSSASQSPAPSSLWRLPVSGAFQSPAPSSLQRLPLSGLPVSGAYQSPAPSSLQRLPVSSAFQSPAPTSLQRLPVSSAF